VRVRGGGVTGGRCAGGLYFFEKARAAEAAGGLRIRRHREMRKLGAPAAAFGLAVHGSVALRAAGLHEESMARRVAYVEVYG